MFKSFYEGHYLPGKFNPQIISNFFESYKFVPYKEYISGYDEDNKNIYVSYQTYIFDTETRRAKNKLNMIDDMPITRNIWCFDKKTGERLWAIDDYPTPKGANPIGPYGGAGFNTEGKLCASGKNVRYEIDINTGKISNPVFTK